MNDNRNPDDPARNVNRPGIRTTNIAAVKGTPPAVNAGAFPGVLSGACSFLMGALMIIAAVLVLVDAARLPVTSDPLGPAAFPFVIGTVLGLIGIALVITNLRFAAVLIRTRGSGPDGAALLPPRNLLRAGLVIVLLVAFAFILPLTGFFVAAALLYMGAALLIGAPLGWHLPITAVILSGAVVLVFDRLIGLTLPAGPWGF